MNEVTFTWTPASGPVAVYAVHVSRNGDPETLYTRVAETRAVVAGQPGDQVVLRVAAEDGEGNRGPFSPASEPIVFVAPTPPPGPEDPPPGDLDGDGASDLILRHPRTGASGIYALEADALVSRGELPAKPLDWKVALVGDLDDNGAADLVWSDPDGSFMEVWLLDAGTLVGGGLLPAATGWNAEECEDANGDGVADLWLRNEDELELWLMDGLEVLAVEKLAAHGADWQLVSARDFDGDGRSDLLWHSPLLGHLELWRMDGATRLETVLVDDTLGGDWTALGAADFDGDGRADALLENRGLGRVAVRSLAAALELAAPDTAERELLTTGDFDGDGREEAVWRNPETSTLDLWTVDPAGIDILAVADPMALDAPGETGCRGDLDGDGWIGAADLALLRGCFGHDSSGACTAADLTGDGKVGLRDYGELRGMYGAACTSP